MQFILKRFFNLRIITMLLAINDSFNILILFIQDNTYECAAACNAFKTI